MQSMGRDSQEPTCDWCNQADQNVPV